MQRKPFSRDDRFGRFDDRRDYRSDRDRFSDDGRRSRPRYPDDRFGERQERFGEDRPARFDDRRFGSGPSRFTDRPRRSYDDRPTRRFDDRPRSRPGFDSDRSGSRAKADRLRRFSDRGAFVKSATVRLDPDVAEYFTSPAAVNRALRQIIALTELVQKKEEPRPAPAPAEIQLAEAKGVIEGMTEEKTAAEGEEAHEAPEAEDEEEEEELEETLPVEEEELFDEDEEESRETVAPAPGSKSVP